MAAIGPCPAGVWGRLRPGFGDGLGIADLSASRRSGRGPSLGGCLPDMAPSTSHSGLASRLITHT